MIITAEMLNIILILFNAINLQTYFHKKYMYTV